mgnify:CR=1 FL=1
MMPEYKYAYILKLYSYMELDGGNPPNTYLNTLQCKPIIFKIAKRE